MDSYFGIAKGDITLSLLNENAGQSDSSKKATWANRVHGAIWRCRLMRRSTGSLTSVDFHQERDRTPARGRSSLPVDLDECRVAGGVRNVRSSHEAALGHLKHDEFDEALELFEDIIFAYYAHFEKTLAAREAGVVDAGTTYFRPYIGVALHNLGILNLLKGEYREAVSYFGRALEYRQECLGEGHPDHL
jgi:tetratricopeptide (TPR) repeat protein